MLRLSRPVKDVDARRVATPTGWRWVLEVTLHTLLKLGIAKRLAQVPDHAGCQTVFFQDRM